MPTDVSVVSIRKEQARADAQSNTTVLLVCIILCLINLALIFTSPTFADAIALTGLY